MARSGDDFQTVLMPAAVRLAHGDPEKVLSSLRLPSSLPGLEEGVDHVGIVVNPWDAGCVVDEARTKGVVTSTADSVVLSREIGPGHVIRIGHGPAPALELFVPSSPVPGERMLSVHVALRLATPEDLAASVELLTCPGAGAYGSMMSLPTFMDGPVVLGDDLVMIYLDHPSGARIEFLAPA